MFGSKWNMKRATVFVLIIFIIDLVVPLGVVIGVLYLVALALVADKGRKVIFRFALICSALALIKFAYYLSNDTNWVVYTNRIITIFSIWITAYLASRLSFFEIQAKNAHVIQKKNEEIENFVFIASHDLNEPIKNMENLLILVKEDIDNKKEDNLNVYLGLMMQLLGKMISINRFLMEFAKIGRFGSLVEIDVNDIMNEVLNELTTLIKESNATIKFNSLPKIYGYKNEIKILFENLISNSLKFRRANINPLIQIEAIKNGNYWTFKVSDNGIGISSKDKDKVLGMFRRSGNLKFSSGMGVGLAACAKIVDLHEGEIWLESEEGKGTEVYFTIKNFSNGKN